MRLFARTGNLLAVPRHVDALITAGYAFAESMFRLLRNTDQPIFSYVWRAWLIALIPSIAIAAIGSLALAMVGYEDPSLDMSLEFLLIWGILIAPWTETLIMWPILAILKRIVVRTGWVALASGIIWGALHSVQALGQGLSATWAFLVLSLCFLELEKKSKGRAIIVTSLIHMCQNSLVFIGGLIIVLLGGETLPGKQVPTATPVHQKEAPASPGHEPSRAVSPVPVAQFEEDDKVSEEEKHKSFERAFPEFGRDEYVLAREDLYPDWRRNVAPNGTWGEFLGVYEEFIRWWEDKGSPTDSGFKLWEDFLADKK